MSSEEDNHDTAAQSISLKKRRVQRACDICRRKKVRCDGGSMPGNRCSNCITYNYECTYVEAAKKRGPPKGYVESLETRLQKMEALLHKLCPDADFSHELGQFDKEKWYSERNDKTPSSSSAAAAVPPPAPDPDADSLAPSDDEISAQRTLANSLKQMKLNPAHLRFFGKSSSVMFIQTAIEAKHEYTGVPKDSPTKFSSNKMLHHKRPQFWTVHPWIAPALHDASPHKDFPPPDLLQSLIDLYFHNFNDYYPLLHRQTFEAQIAEGLHLRDEGFGSTVLLVCAVGSRFSDDPRVFLEGSESTHSCGWKYFRQVQLVRKSLLAPPRLYDLQICALTSLFLQSTSAPQACWTVIGVGIRLAQDVGAHRRKVYGNVSTVEDELWKRAFWVLVSLDRVISIALGRPCAIQDEDFDLELPVECDDEYWVVTDHELKFQQPPGKPSKITFFNCLMRLNQILAFALRTIYSINKSKILLGFVGQQWEQHIVAELDSALNKWIDSVPDHLRWDPNRENPLFLNQSAFLYAHYYQLQISVHRPFIPSPRKPSPLSFPSLAICTNAARSCTHVLDVPFRRFGTVLFHNQIALFTSGIVLLLNIWGGKRSGLTIDPAKEMTEVHKCMKMLKHLESRWHTAGRLWDVLYELASVGDLPLPQSSPAPSQKRDRDSEGNSPASNSLTSSPQASSAPTPATSTSSGAAAAGGGITSTGENVRNVAGSRRVSRESYMPQSIQGYGSQPQASSSASASSSSSSYISQHHSSSMHGTNGGYTLPIYTEELGRIPIHPGINNSDPLVASGWHTHAAGPVHSGVDLAGMGSGLAGSSVLGTGSMAGGGGGSHHHHHLPQHQQQQQQGGFDPSTAAMLAMSPSMFDQMMTNIAAPLTSSSSHAYSQHSALTAMTAHLVGSGAALNAANLGGGHGGGAGGEGMGMQGTEGMDPTTAALYAGNQSLGNVWSTTPHSLEWDDWGTYISNVTGLGNPANDADRHAQSER
ncbi:hypothetical protein K474DRAFT_57243 [Panus rudis PR-1116 ss-1]|nr:hypothetical protein K474DRAFT_57243 [Panus rudis PR-1116 ss-1]